MRIWPVLLDSQPSYLQGQQSGASLLLAPLGVETLLEHVRHWLEPITRSAPIVLAPADHGSAYRQGVLEICADARVVSGSQEFVEALAGLELSDALIIVDPQCLPKRDIGLSELTRQYTAEPRVSHHLVAFESAVAGTMERVSFDAAGNVRGIHRYYEPTTWPFVTGVAAMVVPVACGVVDGGQVPRSLAELRRNLAARGVPSRDVPIDGGALDLTQAQGFLAANEQSIARAAGSRSRAGVSVSPIYVGAGHSVDPSARIVGPVVIHAGVTIEENVTILGPATIGSGARLEEGAVVAHAAIGPGVTVPRMTTVRDCVAFAAVGGEAVDRPGHPPLSYSDRQARLGTDRDEHQGPPASDRRLDLGLKRAFDVVVAAGTLLLLSPLMLMAALLVWIESRGSILFGDQREGVGGRGFRCWKFRTMFVGAHAAQQQLKALDHTDGPHFKVDRDPRVTRAGRILRALNVDELPQLFNVLLGEMSLVGPRPSPFRENQLCIPWREARLSVRPGMTGLWQVCRHDRSEGDFHQWIEYDLLYVQHLSFWLDLKIIVATVCTLAGKLHVPASWLIRPRAVERANAPTAADIIYPVDATGRP